MIARASDAMANATSMTSRQVVISRLVAHVLRSPAIWRAGMMVVMLRPILATAIFMLLIAAGALPAYCGNPKTLTPAGRSFLVVSSLALMWIAGPLGAAYAIVAYVPPGNHWQRWWRLTAGWTCFLAVFGLFALAVKWWLLPLVGERIGSLVYCGVSGICIYLLLKRLQRPKK
jgi:hypothetical protein